MAELEAKGVVFTRPAADYPRNARVAYFLDPDDYIRELQARHPAGPEHDLDLDRASGTSS